MQTTTYSKEYSALRTKALKCAPEMMMYITKKIPKERLDWKVDVQTTSTRMMKSMMNPMLISAVTLV